MLRHSIAAFVVLVGVTSGVTASEAVEPPVGCLADPAMNGTGWAVAPSPADGFGLDRVTVDSSGRLHTINVMVVNEEYVADRVRRFNRDGSVDTSFGDGGFVDLPGEAYNIITRNVAVDALGRVWVMRTTFTNLIEIRRITPSGELDESFPLVEQRIFPPSEFGFFGDMVADGNEMIVAWSTISNGRSSYGPTSLTWRRYGSDGAELERRGNSLVHLSEGLNIYDASASGWIVGSQRDGDTVYPMAWSSADPSVQIWRGSTPGVLTSVSEVDGRTIAVGYRRDEAENIFSVELGRAGEYTAPVGMEIVETASPTGTLPLWIGPNGQVIGLEPDVVPAEESDLSIGHVAADGSIVIDEVIEGVGVFGFPTAGNVLSDGALVIAGYHSDRGSAFAVQLTPTIGEQAVPQALDDQIERLYLAFFGRVPTAEGLAYWRNERARGISVESMAAVFAGGPEFETTYASLRDDQFVDLVYNNVLGRPPEPSGRQFWTGELGAERVSRGELMVRFSDGVEFVAQTGTIAPHDADSGSVSRLYRAYFDRDPAAAASCYWVRRVAGGFSLAQVSDAFAQSPEFQSVYGAVDDAAFVDLVYRNVLGRPGEASGVDFWLSQLTAGALTRGEVMVAFSESPEYVIKTSTLPR